MKKNKSHNKKGIWFVKVRWSYLPCSWQGWLLYIPMILFLLVIVIVIDWQTYSFVNALLSYFTYFICTGVVMHWIASNKS